MYINTPHGARPYGRTGAAALAALSVIATGGAVLALPGAAQAAPPAADSVYRGQTSGAHLTVRIGRGITGPMVPRTPPSRITVSDLTANKATILKGRSIELTGRLLIGKVRQPLAKQAVRLEEKAGGQWKTIGEAIASSDGTVTFTVRPARSAMYRLAYAGVRAYRASISPERAVAVKLPPPPPVVRPASPASSSSSGSGAPAGVSVIGSDGQSGSATGAAIVAAAAALSGKPYVYAAAGPNAFDCSGLTQYVFAQFGISLPHNAQAQLGYGTPVTAAAAAPGDLIFFLDGGYAYHVGIYAGGNQMVDAPNSGSTVGYHTIWSTNVAFRRIV